AEGRRLLAHELAHVVQQSGRPPIPASPITAEAEAGQAAQRAVFGQPAPIQTAVPAGLQRQALSRSDLEAQLRLTEETLKQLRAEAEQPGLSLSRQVSLANQIQLLERRSRALRSQLDQPAAAAKPPDIPSTALTPYPIKLESFSGHAATPAPGSKAGGTTGAPPVRVGL